MELNEIVINNDEKLCYVAGEPINLSKTEYKLLSFLLDNKGIIYSQEELIDNVWVSDVTKRAVDVVISRIRKKLGKELSKYIVTRNGFGYGIIE